tara:strand:- start:29 stop:136 length:108 start_codon:yes stop_codon:yes gene_type:complete
MVVVLILIFINIIDFPRIDEIVENWLGPGISTCRN